MIVTTTETVAGSEIIEVMGLVRGNTIRARHVGRDLVAGLRTIVGGEIHEYAKLMGEAREQALDRMVAEASSLGANAIVNVRFSTSVIINGAAEMLAYGTAVKIESRRDAG
ncbi:MAG: YbjQ family protein [Planctomycetota bacterium]